MSTALAEPRDLVNRFKEGDSEAFGALYDRYERDLMSFVHRNVGSDRASADHDAEEICSAAWLELPKAVLGYQGKSSFKTWLCGLGRRKVWSYRRDRKQNLEKPMPADPDGGDSWQSVLDRSLTAEQELSVRERSAKVNTALAALPQHVRDVVVRRHVQCLGYDVICGELKISERTARNYLKEGLEVLQEALSDYADDGRRGEASRGM